MTSSDQRHPWTGLSGLLLTALVVTGCGGDRTYPVEGKVLFKDGAPAKELAGYTVDFELASAEKKISATGEVREDGTFTVGTFKGDDGAVVGKHRVALSPPLATDDRPMPRAAIADRYRDFKKSRLVVEIKPGRNQVVLEVERGKRPR
jgi:hypothetical protein